jgi:hypothetical protein
MQSYFIEELRQNLFAQESGNLGIQVDIDVAFE